MVFKIIEILKEQPEISQDGLGNRLGLTHRVVQKYMNILKETGRIERIGGKRYGYWKKRRRSILTQFLTQFLKKRTKKEGTGRHLPMTEIPYFSGTTALYDTGRNSRERRPISNKIPSPRWAVTKVAVHLHF